MDTVDTPAARREDSLADVPEPVVRPFEDGDRQTGRFAYDVRNDRWEWDDDVFAIHGYEPGEVEPTTELFLMHKHDGDRDRVEQTFKHAVSTGDPFNLYYRIRTKDGERRVVVVGEGIRDGDGQVEQLVGYYLDLTPEFAAENAAAADAAVAASAAARETIEQAKGILMLGYGLDSDAAFAMLRWWSRNRNVKVREIADRLIEVARMGHMSHPGLRGMLDGLIDDLTTGRKAPADRSGANPDKDR
ncbi:PAS and ANTAR domain-containing protein [Nocardioides bizhenqiangii]|uniref:PAS and ANTAR domain-containing protein n=1 Tax=Nocardioides bizhenqiangii TaxID=3095076 RepID=A0ABZ0ZSA0_9ACTN|nr:MULTISPECIES: PAS and ANTAR domain-containing protein [unclassified Nocardioides]MDZ5623524.1 PAS and ANTAR domain-containing protein [Nocardioides sp. HM23]WQQ27191.1 PAS and ANTAR domain-containing protein [Nocardioides sp. HM61]